jgi:hypothetical protein
MLVETSTDCLFYWWKSLLITVIVISYSDSLNLIAQIVGYSSTEMRIIDKKVGKCMCSVTILPLLPEFYLCK